MCPQYWKQIEANEEGVAYFTHAASRYIDTVIRTIPKHNPH